MKNRVIFFAMLLLSSAMSFLCAQSYSVLFYNVENLFNPEEDSSLLDKQFIPEGERHWSWYKYWQKINSISKVIIASGEWHYPDFVALCEIENRQVLEDIVEHPLLLKLNYGIVHKESKDHRGMDVAVLFRKDCVQLLQEEFITPYSKEGEIMLTRDILLGKFLIGEDTLILSMNHWTSKYGGEMETEEKRCSQASLLGLLMDSISENHPDYFLLAGGDFNDDSNSKSLNTLKRVSGMEEASPQNFAGTYKYQGRWSRIDHVFYGGVFEKFQLAANVVILPFLLEKDDKNGGEKPFRTYEGFRYHGGISDHLPLLFLFEEGGLRAD